VKKAVRPTTGRRNSQFEQSCVRRIRVINGAHKVLMVCPVNRRQPPDCRQKPRTPAPREASAGRAGIPPLVSRPQRREGFHSRSPSSRGQFVNGLIRAPTARRAIGQIGDVRRDQGHRHAAHKRHRLRAVPQVGASRQRTGQPICVTTDSVAIFEGSRGPRVGVADGLPTSTSRT
jgi:hypothetical protein